MISLLFKGIVAFMSLVNGQSSVLGLLELMNANIKTELIYAHAQREKMFSMEIV